MANKWGILKAIIISSVVFGIGHSDIIGATLVGVVLSVVYLNSKSLFVPIIIHIANNGLVYFARILFGYTEYTISDFQSDWWIGLVSLIIGLPWCVYFFRKEVSKNLFIIPYFQNQRK